MCSINEANDIEDLTVNIKLTSLKEKSTKALQPGMCNKCKKEKPILCLRTKDVYCRQCFLAGSIHKFKMLLGKHRLINENDRILVPFDGSHESIALIQFLKYNLDNSNPKRLNFQPILLIIEKHFKGDLAKRKEHMEKLEKHAKLYNYPVYFSSLLEFILNKNVSCYDINSLNIGLYDQSIISFRAKIPENKVGDLWKILEKQMLLELAKKFECKFIFLSDIITEVAFDILKNISSGSGQHLALNAGFIDDRDSKVTIIKPLKFFEVKELALFNYFNNVDAITLKNQNQERNLEKLIRSFIKDLQLSYPATLNTITRTADKLSNIKDKNLEDIKTCQICKGEYKTIDFKELNAASALEYSRIISRKLDYQPTSSFPTNCNVNVEDSSCFSCSKLKQYLYELKDA